MSEDTQTDLSDAEYHHGNYSEVWGVRELVHTSPAMAWWCKIEAFHMYHISVAAYFLFLILERSLFPIWHMSEWEYEWNLHLSLHLHSLRILNIQQGRAQGSMSVYVACEGVWLWQGFSGCLHNSCKEWQNWRDECLWQDEQSRNWHLWKIFDCSFNITSRWVSLKLLNNQFYSISITEYDYDHITCNHLYRYLCMLSCMMSWISLLL